MTTVYLITFTHPRTKLRSAVFPFYSKQSTSSFIKKYPWMINPRIAKGETNEQGYNFPNIKGVVRWYTQNWDRVDITTGRRY